MERPKYLYWLITLLVLGIVAWTAVEITSWHQVIGIGALVWKAALLGLLLGLVAGYFIGSRFREPLDRMRILLFAGIGGGIIFLTLSSFLDRTFASPPEQEAVEFIRLDMYGADRFGQWRDSLDVDGYFLFFKRLKERDTFRIRLQYPYPGPPQTGDTIMLPFRQGLLGTEIIDLR